MFSPEKNKIYEAPLNEDGVKACRKTDCGIKKATVHLGRTLPSLLDEGCELALSDSATRFSLRRLIKRESSTATISHYSEGRWQRWSLLELRRAAEEVALGLHQYPAIEKGDRAALLLDSNVPFVMADIGCLLAQLVTVPISPDQSPNHSSDQSLTTSEYILQETAASVLFVSRLEQVKQLLPKLADLTALRLIVVAGASHTQANNSLEDSSENSLMTLKWSLPETIDLITLQTLRQREKWSASKAQTLRAALHPQDLATIVYTLSATGQPLGAMLTHENLSGSALAAFNTLPCLRKGPSEVALSFLPLHHVFARGFVYGSLSYGQSLYFSTPRRVMKHLQALQPTVFFAVPRLLEKVYEGWLAVSRPSQISSGLLLTPKQTVLNWAMAWAWNVAKRYRLEAPQSLQYRAQLWIARQSVLRSLKNLFGGRLQCFIVGGAALSPEVMTLMSATGLKLCQGYGLTEAGSTLSFTRRQWSRAGTVGVPMPGVSL
ncbi:MAG: AMP-binding protein, partial [Phormidesmis sp.]